MSATAAGIAVATFSIAYAGLDNLSLIVAPESSSGLLVLLEGGMLLIRRYRA